jgi:hypothetical protein
MSLLVGKESAGRGREAIAGSVVVVASKAQIVMLVRILRRIAFITEIFSLSRILNQRPA